MGKKLGNDRERQRHRVEDAIIGRIDNPKPSFFRNHGPLKVAIIDLIAYRCLMLDRPIKKVSHG